MSDWFGVAPLSEFPVGDVKRIDVDDTVIAVFNIDGDFYALEDICTHDNVPIVAMLDCGISKEQLIEGNELVCPRHGGRFCIKTGKALNPPVYEDVSIFPVKIENGLIQVRDDRWDE